MTDHVTMQTAQQPANSFSAEEINAMNYAELVGLVGERNRPSGGIRTVHTVAVNSFLSSSSEVLEIGCNTGFTAVNLSLLCGAKVTGIDTNQPSLDLAVSYAIQQGVAEKVCFQNCSALALPFADSSFDLVWASNVTSFVSEKQKAIGEYLRVLKPGGVLAFVPIYYRDTPPAEVVKDVGAAIGCAIDVRSKAHWLELIEEVAQQRQHGLELMFSEDWRYHRQGEKVEDFCCELLGGGHLEGMSRESLETLRSRFTELMKLFDLNLSYCGYSILLLQKRMIRDQEELFTGERVNA